MALTGLTWVACFANPTPHPQTDAQTTLFGDPGGAPDSATWQSGGGDWDVPACGCSDSPPPPGFCEDPANRHNQRCRPCELVEDAHGELGGEVDVGPADPDASGSDLLAHDGAVESSSGGSASGPSATQ